MVTALQQREQGRGRISFRPHFTSGGLTIGAGLDLSRWKGEGAEQKYRDFLDSAGLSNRDKEVMLLLIPALGKTGDEAKEITNKFKGLMDDDGNPLIKIGEDSRNKLFDTSHAEIKGELLSGYGESEYNSLPREMQEVLMEGAFQYGVGTEKKRSTPGLWKAMKSSQRSGDYSAVRGQLENWGDATKDIKIRESINTRYRDLSGTIDWASLTPSEIETELIEDWAEEPGIKELESEITRESEVSGVMPDLEVTAKREEKPSFDVPTALRGMDREEAPREIKPVEDSLVDSMVQDDQDGLEMPDFFKRLGAAIGRKLKYNKSQTRKRDDLAQKIPDISVQEPADIRSTGIHADPFFQEKVLDLIEHLKEKA